MALCALTSACAVPSAATLPRELPVAFENAADAEGQWPAKEWYRSFSSDELNTFVNLANKNNTDVVSVPDRRVLHFCRASMPPAMPTTLPATHRRAAAMSSIGRRC